MEFHHVSVLPAETIAALAVVPDGTYVDCTLGGAGHAGRIAAQLSPAGRLIGIDQDETAIAAAQVRLASAACRVSLVHDNFRNLTAILAAEGVSAVDGILFDLGVSSPQIDTAARGFSYMQDAPLDMRMDRRAARSAYTVVNEYSAARLTELFYTYGEERWAKRIAAFIEAARKERPIETTGELVEIIDRKGRASRQARLSGDPHRGQRGTDDSIGCGDGRGTRAETGRTARGDHVPLARGSHCQAHDAAARTRLYLPSAYACLHLRTYAGTAAHRQGADGKPRGVRGECAGEECKAARRGEVIAIIFESKFDRKEGDADAGTQIRSLCIRHTGRAGARTSD